MKLLDSQLLFIQIQDCLSDSCMLEIFALAAFYVSRWHELDASRAPPPLPPPAEADAMGWVGRPHRLRRGAVAPRDNKSSCT